MMETIKNIRHISIWFFIALGATYILTGLMNIAVPQSETGAEAFIIHQTIQIPFLIACLAYGGSSLISSIANPEKSNKILFVIIGTAAAIFLAAIIILEMLFPDNPPLL